MMTEEQKEAFEAVEKINEELFEYFDNKLMLNNQPILSITFADYITLIGLSIPLTLTSLEINIYNSEYDDRNYNEKDDEYEKFYPFIKRKFNEIKEEISLINL
ncbi:MAG: hypothetical protein WC996_04330 [Peptostreptococcales bacterium]